MKVGRRGFFGVVGAAFAGAAVEAMPSAASMPAIEAIMRDSGGKEGLRYGSWKIMWTGWKESMNSIERVGQWVACPITKNGEFDSERWPLYSSVPGWYGAFHRGDTFCIDLRPYQRWPNFSFYMLPDDGFSVSEAERETGLRILLELIHQGSWEKKKTAEEWRIPEIDPPPTARLTKPRLDIRCALYDFNAARSEDKASVVADYSFMIRRSSSVRHLVWALSGNEARFLRCANDACAAREDQPIGYLQRRSIEKARA